MSKRADRPVFETGSKNTPGLRWVGGLTGQKWTSPPRLKEILKKYEKGGLAGQKQVDLPKSVKK